MVRFQFRGRDLHQWVKLVPKREEITGVGDRSPLLHALATAMADASPVALLDRVGIPPAPGASIRTFLLTSLQEQIPATLIRGRTTT